MAHAEGNRSNASRDTSMESRNDSIDGVRAKRRPKSPSPRSQGYESCTEHKYHDYANVTELPMQLASQFENRGSGGVCNPFPVVLYTLLSEASLFGFSNIISWQPHGRSFLIHRSKEFVRDIVPKYFKHSKLASFQRQLSLYGFTRMCQESPDRGSYFHEVSIFTCFLRCSFRYSHYSFVQLFLRGRFCLCTKIHRTRVKGTWVRSSASPQSEPNFLAMDPVVDLGEESSSTQTESALQTCDMELRRNCARDHGLLALHLDTNPDPTSTVHSSHLHTASDFLDNQLKQEATLDFVDSGLVSLLAEEAKGNSDQIEPVDYHRKWSDRNNVHSLLSLGRSTTHSSQLLTDASFSDLGSFFLDIDLAAELDSAEEYIRSAIV